MALGKIKADTLEHSTAGTVDTLYVVNGSAKSWVNFNGTGTVAIVGSLNVSSLTDSGTGDYRVNYSSNMGNVTYTAATANSSAEANGSDTSVDGLLTSYWRPITRNSSGTAIDTSVSLGIVMGDLA
tara:strand:+ start:348 stop:725 length:378 start_codon:yes stop_codon:yes gene_type:complete